MAVTINASTSAGLVMTSDLSGVLTLQQNGVSLPNGGVAPAFRATASGSQTLSVNTNTKIAFNTKVFDTNTNYDATTNYRFTPTVAGYYQVSAGANAQTTVTTTAIVPSIYKNGSVYETGNAVPCSTYTYGYSQVTTLVYCNGSTDYIECYAQATGASGTVVCAGVSFQACLVRGA